MEKLGRVNSLLLQFVVILANWLILSQLFYRFVLLVSGFHPLDCFFVSFDFMWTFVDRLGAPPGDKIGFKSALLESLSLLLLFPFSFHLLPFLVLASFIEPGDKILFLIDTQLASVPKLVGVELVIVTSFPQYCPIVDGTAQLHAALHSFLIVSLVEIVLLVRLALLSCVFVVLLALRQSWPWF